jgi:hypothetical protein
METEKNLMDEFSVNELESRLEMKQPWIESITVCDGNHCDPGA